MFTEIIYKNLSQQKNCLSFFIDGEKFSYQDLKEHISGIQELIKTQNIIAGDIVVVETFNDIETYSSVTALWFLGITFVPLNPKHPIERNNKILKQVKPKLILSSQNKKNAVNTKGVKSDSDVELYKKIKKNDILYLIFTSGSTGIPKGVKISYKNLSAFLKNFLSTTKLTAKDRFLQVYDLTFDSSFHSWVLPLYLGASVFTVNPDKPKYLQAYKLMEEQKLTFAKFPPSLLTYLRPYFSKIHLPHLRYCFLGGESLNLKLALDWAPSVPNADLLNIYGPTEATIDTHIYKINPKQTDTSKVYKGNLAIGHPFGDTQSVIIDSEKNILPKGKQGELCLSGKQISPGYFSNKIINKSSFIELNIKGKQKRFYKTGDFAFIDSDNDYMFCGRIDDQVQINGFRVETGEIEALANSFGNALNYVAVAKANSSGIVEISLFSLQYEGDTQDLLNYLKKNLPSYMVPTKLFNLDEIPHTPGGKVDRRKLKSMI